MFKKILAGAVTLSLLFASTTMGDEKKDQYYEVVTACSDGVVQHITEMSGQIASEKVLLLAQLIEAEAGNQDIIGRMYVGNVVLNRVNSPRFPNTIESVIYQPGQFTVMRNGRFNRVRNSVSMTSIIAAMSAIDGNGDHGILYFGTRPVNGKHHWKHGGHWFSY